ncbi:MAG: HD domain-containing protein, partial [Planctomycetota bacterium]
NEYHKFTVDEHSLQAVRKVIELESQNTVAARVYKQIKEKNLLHLALLLHDLGKGYPEDHCDVGARISDSIGKRLYLAYEDIQDVRFLVQNHLVMSHLAFHRDINDENMIAEFASNVGTVRMLSMLFVLTCADIQAVGPDVLTDWKYNLLTSLYQNARNILTGDHADSAHPRVMERKYAEIGSHGPTSEVKIWLKSAARNLPKNYCQQHDSEEIAQQLSVMRSMKRDEVRCWVKKCSGSKLFEICIGKSESRRSGLLFKIFGLLASQGLAVRSADIKSVGGSIVLYWFKFEDKDFDTPPKSRLDDLRDRALDLAKGLDDGPPTFRSKWGIEESAAQKMARPRIEVKIDNQTVESATIIDVFAYRKIGLLYRISKQIHKIGLDVNYARISTYARQLISVFYVTDEQGNKIRNKNQLQVIKQEIYRVTKDYLEPAEP